jgi:imidazolonepropionase-like amidohydrolase
MAPNRRWPIHRRPSTLSLAVLLPAASLCADEPRAAGPLQLTGAKVLDVSGERFLDGKDVLVDRGRIVAVASPAELKPPAGATRIDVGGLYVIPGLMDIHTHLMLHPYDETKWDDQVLRESLESRVIRAVVAGRATVEAGFTTIRDLGTEGAGVADVALRDAFAQDRVVGPRVLASTRAIVATGCYGPAGLDPRWLVPQGADEASGEAECRKVVRRQIAHGADWVKFYADFPRRPGAPATATFSQAEMNAIVDEARSAGLPVAAHSTTSEGIRRAVLAGVTTIEHGYEASDDVLGLMRERGVALCPTLAAAEAYARYGGWQAGQVEPDDWKRTKEMFARALAAKVTIACGSDAGVFAHGDNARELELMVECGMLPVAALRAATLTAAKVLGREKDLGVIAPGAVADLVVVSSDPLASISAIRNPVLVVKEGRVVSERRARK